MTTILYYKIPVDPGRPSDFSVTLAGKIYLMSLRWRDNDQAGWVLDIYDVNANPLACGIPLITGFDLLMQFKYLGIDGCLVMLTDGDPYQVPTFEGLGVESNLYFAALGP